MMSKILVSFTLFFICTACLKVDEDEKVKQFFKKTASLKDCLITSSTEETDSLNKLILITSFKERNIVWCEIVGYMTAYELSKVGLDKELIQENNAYLFSFQFDGVSELAFEVPVPNDYSTFKRLPIRYEFSKIVAQQMSPSDISAYDSLFLVLHQETKKDFFSQNFDRFFTTVTTNEYLDNNEEEILDSLISRSDKIPSVSSKGLRIFKNNLEELIILDEGEQ